MSGESCPRCGAKKAFAQGPSYIDFRCGSYIARESGKFSGGCKEQIRKRGHGMKPRKFHMGAKVKERKWYISAGGFGDGKSVCLWMQEGVVSAKIARFQSVEAATVFIQSFQFPVSDRVQKLLDKEVME